MCKPSGYITSHLGQLALAILPWAGAMSICSSCGWGVNGHNTRCSIGRICVVSQCMLTTPIRNRDQRPPQGLMWLGKDFAFYCQYTVTADDDSAEK